MTGPGREKMMSFFTWWRGCLDVSFPESGGLLISMVCMARMLGPIKAST